MALSYRATQTLIKRRDEPGLRAALSAGLDPNLANHNGWSILMLAAIEGAVPLGRLLLEQGADVNATNRHGETALSLAAHKGHMPFLKLLLEHGAARDPQPHGSSLEAWLAGASGLPADKLAEITSLLTSEGASAS